MWKERGPFRRGTQSCMEDEEGKNVGKVQKDTHAGNGRVNGPRPVIEHLVCRFWTKFGVIGARYFSGRHRDPQNCPELPGTCGPIRLGV